MTKYFFALLFAAAVRQGFAEDKTPAAPPAAAIAAPACTSAPASAASDVQPSYGASAAAPKSGFSPYRVHDGVGQSESRASTLAEPGPSPYRDSLSKADHLRIAAEHLEAAGRVEEARRVRQLEAEEQAKQKSESIIVKLRMFEVSLTKLDQASSEKYGGSKDMTVLQLLTRLQASQGAGTDEKRAGAASGDCVGTLFEALCRESLARAVARPRIATVVGRPAFVFVGGEIGYPSKDAQGQDITLFKEYGTRADVVANLDANDRIHLDVRLRVSQPDAASSVQVGNNLVPAITTRELESALNLRSGQTVLIGGLVENRAEAICHGPTHEVQHVTNKVETFVLAQAEVATEETAAKALMER